MSRSSRSRLLALVPVTLLFLVAAVQLNLVVHHELDPWKGGGFGMFSTIDNPSTRVLRVVAVTADGLVPLEMPSAVYAAERSARALPSEERLGRVAERLLDRTELPEGTRALRVELWRLDFLPERSAFAARRWKSLERRLAAPGSKAGTR